MRCEPANTIIQKFKGLKPLADAAGVTVHSVMRWRTPKHKGGTGGAIPHWHIEAILASAEERSIDLCPTDFFPSREAAA